MGVDNASGQSQKAYIQAEKYFVSFHKILIINLVFYILSIQSTDKDTHFFQYTYRNYLKRVKNKFFCHSENYSYLFSNFIECGTEGIDEAGSADGLVRVTVKDGRIVVEGAEGETVRVYDMMGCEVHHNTALADEPSALPGGVYLVKVGNLPARKVVVVR
ncbi:MAG: DUF6383 domain-containing protein [bacterium]